ncbi:TIR domain-containing protein [Kitasatospora sp. NPDC057015]|uniref:TIR domain-containing protein n=1 Tax=Kitasatospora sp. NPDC057015 TaxID=3346001 RepID=UPI003633B8F8
MGFQADSAEGVYRYAFRRDGRDSSLSDGFGWTILLLGDSGDATREFLLHYGAELSARSAHRVRFAFFSGARREHIEDVVMGGRPGVPLVRRFFDLLQQSLPPESWRRAPLDWEAEDWRDLRPPVFRPFAGAHEIELHFDDFAALLRRAIPGTDESWKLAQTLGIGRQVPCLLLFTDLGARRFHVLPFGDRSADEVYDRVRGWIDDFYALNREALEHWSSIEEQIRSHAAQARVALETIRNWPAERRRQWLALSLLTEAARAARENPDAALGQLTTVTDSGDVPWAFTRELHPLGVSAEGLRARERQAAQLTDRVERLRAAREPGHIAWLLQELAEERLGFRLEAASSTRIAESAVLWTGRRPVHPRTELFRWWRGPSGNLCSKRAFDRLRYGWRSVCGRTQPVGEPLSVGAARDYAALWAILGACPLGADASVTADQVLAGLAGHYGVEHASPEWLASAAGLHAHLKAGIRQAQQEAPGWLLDISPPLTIGACMLRGGSLDQDGPEKALAGLPRLAAAVAERAEDLRRHADLTWGPVAHLRHRDLVVAALQDDIDRRTVPPQERAALNARVCEGLDAGRTRVRAEIENGTAQGLGARSDIARLERNAEVAARLEATLREYDAVVRTIQHPHTRDPWVVALPLPRHLDRTVGLGDEDDSRNPVARASAEVDRLREDTRKALAEYERAADAGARWDPEVRFAEVFAQVVPAARAEAVLQPFDGASLHEKVLRAGRERRLTDVLAGLARHEMVALAENARPAGSGQPGLRSAGAVTPGAVLTLFGLPAPPRVFVSYAHEDDGGAHTGRVRELWELLRRHGVDARLDLPAAEQPRDWPVWMREQYRSADFVVVIGSPAYRRRAHGEEDPGVGHGVAWEAGYLRSEVYEHPHDWHRRILKVLLPGGDPADFPDFLGGRTVTHYPLAALDGAGIERLLRYLTGKPHESTPPIGPPPFLPPRPAR